MFMMPIQVVVESIKAAKDAKSNNYADFLFTGGMVSIPVDQAAFDILKPLEGSEAFVIFQMKPSTITSRFGRPVSVFEPVKFIRIQK